MSIQEGASAPVSGGERRYSTIDKSEWGDGPWQSEPDKVQWTDEATGFPCLANRTASGGHWCGYVAVSEGHPAFGVGYDDVRVLDEDGDATWPEVHCGLTYANHCQEGDESVAICHVPEPGQPDHVWWLGFDCAHSGDISPAYRARERKRYEETGDPIWSGLGFGYERYATLAYVQRQCASLAKQLLTAVTAADAASKEALS